MESFIILQVLILGIVEGLTEFLPVSSTGHLIIVGDLIQFDGEKAKTFEIFIQLGSILGVLWLYRGKVWNVAKNISEKPAQRFVINLAIAFLPAAVVGLLLHKMIKAHLFTPVTVAGALIVGGIIILLIESYPRKPRVETVDDMSNIDALKVGFAQMLALFPGVSRAGATIMGGLLTGLSRTAATEFSFFLAIPTMFAATLYDLYKSRELLHMDDALPFALGFVTAFATALFVVKLFVAFIGKHDFKPFAYYRIVFGLIVLWYFW